ncbi:MAG: DUF4340 domain-containing protein [Chloroflexi bacterium]|nr:DUF4340 domain-containing protein [Chloroflexota bacterium]
MNRKETVVLVLILMAAFGAVVGYLQTRSDPPRGTAPPFFYEIEATDIVSVRVEQGGMAESFVWDEEAEEWRFDDEVGESVDEERWGGMPVLLAGPRIERTLPDGLELDALGLEPPMASVIIGLEPSGEFRVLIGRRTPDGSAHYVKQSNNDTVFLVNAAWGDVISRLVTEPPRVVEADSDTP